jgi:hypothetical protein
VTLLVRTLPGRFWGYRGSRPVLAIRQITPAVGIAAPGECYAAGTTPRGLTKQVTVMRVEQSTGRVRYRRSRKRKRLMTHNRGFVVVNDGPAVASQLARYLANSGVFPPDRGEAPAPAEVAAEAAEESFAVPVSLWEHAAVRDAWPVPAKKN